MKSLLNLPNSLMLAYSSLRFKCYFPLSYQTSLVSTKEISKGSEIFEIEDWISGKEMTVLEQFKRSFIKDVFDYIVTINPDTPNLMSRLQIAHQISVLLRDKSSRLYDYVNSLPTQHKNYPIYWNNNFYTSCIPLRQLIGAEYFMYNNAYEKIFDFDKQILSSINKEEFIWANTITLDRSVQIKDSLELVPIFDTFPHSFDNNTDILKDAKILRIFATKDIPAYTVLTRNYGNYDNYTFMFKHGLIPDQNPYHLFPVFPETLSEWNEAFNKLRINDTSVLNQRENPKNFSMNSLKKMLFKRFDKEGGLIGSFFPLNPPAVDLETSFRIFFLVENDLNELGIKNYEQVKDLDFTKEITQRNERNVRVFILKCALLSKEFFETTFVGSHSDGKKIEDLDKELIERYISYYKSLI